MLSGGGDLICGFPTGYGKSVCYALPALHLGALALVVSPLCSLIHDQTTSLNARAGARVALDLSGMGGAGDLAQLRSHTGGALLVFTTPERLQVDGFLADLLALHARQPVAYVVLDEAHMVSEQGHSFRPDYLKIGSVRAAFAGTPVYCFSATCTAFVRAHLTTLLGLREPRRFSVADRRENMHLHVHHVRKGQDECTCGGAGCMWPVYAHSEPAAAFVPLVQGQPPGAVLVFATTHREVDAVHKFLQARMPTREVAAYHGGMPDEERAQAQARFVGGDIDVLVATTASFGTGVDMQRVSRVVLCGVPSSVHTLVQSIGRGGRNGREYRVDVFACEAALAKARAMLEREVSAPGCPPLYAQYRRESLSMAERFVRLASAPRGARACMAALLAQSGEAAPVALAVPYAHLQRFKACNAQAAPADRARWDAARRRWFLPPAAHNAHVLEWAPPPRADGAPPERPCGRCTACTAPPPTAKRRRAARS